MPNSKIIIYFNSLSSLSSLDLIFETYLYLFLLFSPVLFLLLIWIAFYFNQQVKSLFTDAYVVIIFDPNESIK